ncbi:MAG TPA: ABC transporter permease [Actinomycetota bacterium]|nr:ABC transporter permease [Actinomycetota bacterium]
MTERPAIDWGWIGENLDLIGERLGEHVWLTVLAVVIGLAIAFPVAVQAYRHPRLYGPVTGVAGVIYTIPSLALFALLLPFTGLSTLTAEIGLVGYTLLILIRNIVTGLRGVPEDARDAARGMGYSDRQLLWKVDVPLALPAVMAGLRIATVSTIGLVTVTALIGKGGVGFLFLAGFRNLYPRATAIVLGLVLSMGLAIAADGLLLGAQRVLMPWTRRAART